MVSGTEVTIIRIVLQTITAPSALCLPNFMLELMTGQVKEKEPLFSNQSLFIQPLPHVSVTFTPGFSASHRLHWALTSSDIDYLMLHPEPLNVRQEGTPQLPTNQPVELWWKKWSCRDHASALRSDHRSSAWTPALNWILPSQDRLHLFPHSLNCFRILPPSMLKSTCTHWC